MSIRFVSVAAAAGIVVISFGALAQGSGNTPLPAVPHDKVTPDRYMAHPRSKPEPVTIDSLNAMSLQAAQRGTTFVPPAPGTEHK
jgi:hypothetical protein